MKAMVQALLLMMAVLLPMMKATAQALLLMMAVLLLPMMKAMPSV